MTIVGNMYRSMLEHTPRAPCFYKVCQRSGIRTHDIHFVRVASCLWTMRWLLLFQSRRSVLVIGSISSARHGPNAAHVRVGTPWNSVLPASTIG